MGCGGPTFGRGMYWVVDRLIDERLGGPRHSHDHSARQRDFRRDIEQELKLMYARGAIGSDVYRRLMEMAQSGDLTWDDLQRIASESEVEIVPQREPAERKRDTAIVNSLNRLYRHRTRLEEAHTQTEQVLQRLEGDVTRLHEQAEAAEEKAQLVLPDEEKARAYLETKQKALDRVKALEERTASLRQSLRRINTLRDELATREAELKALESGEQLAELEASIREDLLDDRRHDDVRR